MPGLLLHSFAQNAVDPADMSLAFRSQPGKHIVVDSHRNRSLERPVVLANGRVLPHFGRQYGGVRIIVQAAGALPVKGLSFVADLQPPNGGIGVCRRFFHKRLPFWPSLRSEVRPAAKPWNLR